MTRSIPVKEYNFTYKKLIVGSTDKNL